MNKPFNHLLAKNIYFDPHFEVTLIADTARSDVKTQISELIPQVQMYQ